MTALVIQSPAALATARKGSLGLVPTMGALHAGHLVLIARAAAENDEVVVSVFVNPAQFGSANDLSRYPRDLDADIAKASAAGASVIYAPDVSTVYPPGFSTWVEPVGLADRWEGVSRPGHFRGVATIVTILLNSLQPDHSYFGEKDFQQLQIIRRMHRDLHLPGHIVASPTVRDIDGVALSSRNARLSSEGRITARKIPLALTSIAEAARSGIRTVGKLADVGRRTLDGPGLGIDYLAIVDAEMLEPVDAVSGNCRVLLAVEIEGVRLIDNIALPTSSSTIEGDPEA